MLFVVGTLVIVAAASIAFALRVTPEQSVRALGQTVTVGTAAPTWSTSGPGEVVLFGRSLPTQVDFIGPVRPRLELTDISINEQVAGLFGTASGPSAATDLGGALVAGWRRYFAWEIAFVALGAVVLLGAIAGWRRYDRRTTVVALLGGLLFVEAVNLSAIMVTAYTAPAVLRGVHSMSGLVGHEGARAVRPAAGPPRPQVQAIVMGDSTAAGLGGPPLPNATAADQACERSSTAFAVTLAHVNDWEVDNLGCSSATIRQGILGPQSKGGVRVPPQLAVAERAVDAKAVIVSIGANDMDWSSSVYVCATSDACDSRAVTAYFQKQLDRFTRDYYELLRQLAALPGDPTIVINQYYVPFDPALDCLAPSGLTPSKLRVLLERLTTINQVLANGAETFGYRTVQPDFSGHELCTDAPYVQGLDDPAPLHPNARGQLVIALADERALLGAR
jgi:lysophospholipase L1-like esterase